MGLLFIGFHGYFAVSTLAYSQPGSYSASISSKLLCLFYH